MKTTISPFPKMKYMHFQKLHPVNNFSNKPPFQQMHTLRIPTSMLTKKDYNENTFKTFRLLMKLKNYLM